MKTKFIINLSILLFITVLNGCGRGDNTPIDTDGDGIEDSLDLFPNDPTEAFDTDEDGIGDNGDNCVDIVNSDQSDIDFDGIGDECDDDKDGDEIANDIDNCPLNGNADQTDSDANGPGDACDPMPTVYAFDNSAFPESDSSVSYVEQTASQLLISDMSYFMQNILVEDTTVSVEDKVSAMKFFVYGTDIDAANTLIGAYIADADNVELKDAALYGDISVSSNLHEKIAGGDGNGNGHVSGLIDGEFFGWDEEIVTLPIDLVNHWIQIQAEIASDDLATIVVDSSGTLSTAHVNIDDKGRNYRQLLNTFLMGAVNFSQGTNNHFIKNFSGTDDDGANYIAAQDGTNAFTVAEHHFDQGFGFYGAARDGLDYTDLEASAISGRDEYKNGYHDSNSDLLIDLRSEYFFGHSQICAERDASSALGTVPTDFSNEVMLPILAARKILSNAANKTNPELTEIETSKLREHVNNVSTGWEKCIAATAIHNINNLLISISNYDNGAPVNIENFQNVAKYWSDLKGYVLSLQFSPTSPFRDNAVVEVDISDLKKALTLIGDAPVLANGSQNGIAAAGSASDAIYAYIGKLIEVRSILKDAYSFSDVNTLSW